MTDKRAEHSQPPNAVEWSYDDPESCARAIEAMANDPEFLREVQAIERDFAPTLNDGLTAPPFNTDSQTRETTSLIDPQARRAGRK